jgi:tetratricopeptide (TPR) repeat protein
MAGCAPNKLLFPWSAEDAQVPPAAQSVPPSSLPPEATIKGLKPETLVALAAVREQIANEKAKTLAEKQRVMEHARGAYQLALKADPNFVPAYLGMARNWEMVEQHGKALSCYEAALKLLPQNAGLWFEVGMCQARHQEWEPALERLKKAVELDRENRQFLSSYALTLALAEHYDESVAWLKMLHTDAEAHFTLARLLQRLEKVELCRQHLKTALELDPGLKAAEHLLATVEAAAHQSGPTIDSGSGSSIQQP